MRLYCGIELHANNSVGAVLDKRDQLVYEKGLQNDLETIVGVLGSYWAVLAG